MANGVVDDGVVEIDWRKSESRGCDEFYPLGLARPGVGA
jgi:hypothetical protein